jgi:hypothetical protein
MGITSLQTNLNEEINLVPSFFSYVKFHLDFSFLAQFKQNWGPIAQMLNIL